MRLIDADAFKEYICNAYEQVKHMYPDGGEWARQITEDFCKDIDEQPTIDQQKWVSCSERLPEESGYYLCTCLDGHRSMVTQVKFHTRIKSWNLTGARAYWRVIAWCPLPEPWKEEETWPI